MLNSALSQPCSHLLQIAREGPEYSGFRLELIAPDTDAGANRDGFLMYIDPGAAAVF